MSGKGASAIEIEHGKETVTAIGTRKQVGRKAKGDATGAGIGAGIRTPGGKRIEGTGTGGVTVARGIVTGDVNEIDVVDVPTKGAEADQDVRIHLPLQALRREAPRMIHETPDQGGKVKKTTRKAS